MCSFIQHCASLNCFIFLQWICIIYTMQKSKVKVDEKKDLRDGKYCSYHQVSYTHFMSPSQKLREDKGLSHLCKSYGMAGGGDDGARVRKSEGVWFSKIGHGMNLPRKVIFKWAKKTGKLTIAYLIFQGAPKTSKMFPSCLLVKKILSPKRFNKL